MNLLLGIDSLKDIRILHKAGVTEYFCGYVLEQWITKYNKKLSEGKELVQMQISPNKRDWIKQNITSYEELDKMCNLIHKLGSKLYVTFNHPFYPKQAYVDLTMLLDDVMRVGVDGIIITDVGLIHFVHEIYPNAKIILSTCQSVFNRYTVKFFQEMGVSRITFPRHISILEMSNIVTEFPEMEFECFLVEGKCNYDDGSCRPLHSAGVFCMDQWEYSYHKDTHEEFRFDELQALMVNEQLFNYRNRAFGGRENRVNGWNYIGCGICAIPKILKHPNIVALKVAGRGYSIEEKYSLAKYVSEAAKKAKNDADINDMKEMGKDVLGMPELCILKRRCYLTVNE